MMPHGVKCSVDSCHFWKEGNKCAAERIAVHTYSRSGLIKAAIPAARHSVQQAKHTFNIMRLLSQEASFLQKSD